MKDFKAWHQLKGNLHTREDIPVFSQREIWWCSIGCNIETIA